jgi:hypothetical protein
MATVTVSLVDKNGSVQANLTGLRWSWFDEDIGALNAPTDQGTTETTDAAGDLALSMPGSALTSGQIGTLAVRDPAGEKLMGYRVAVD